MVIDNLNDQVQQVSQGQTERKQAADMIAFMYFLIKPNAISMLIVRQNLMNSFSM